MKRTKELTRSQRILLRKKGMDPANYRLVMNRPTYIIVYNTATQTEETVLK